MRNLGGKFNPVSREGLSQDLTKEFIRGIWREWYLADVVGDFGLLEVVSHHGDTGCARRASCQSTLKVKECVRRGNL